MPDDTPNDASAATGAPTGQTASESADAPAAGTRRRPSPAAAAASRARRIGGSTSAGRSATAGTAKASAPAPDAAAPDAPATEMTTKRGSTSVSTRKKPAAALKDGETTSDAAEAAPKRTKTPREAPPWLSWLPAGVLVAAALIMLIVLATASHGVWWGQDSATTARDQVLAAAKTCTVNTNSYSYLTFDADKKKGEACTTGAQTQRYSNAMESLIRAKAKTLKASQVAQINTAGVQAITKGGRQWTILVFGQIKIITSQTGKTGRIDPFAARVRMDNVNGTWLLSAIDTVTSAAP